MADRVDEDHTREMEQELNKLDEHLDEARDKKGYVDSKAERAGDAIEGGPDEGAAGDTLSASGSSDDGEEGSSANGEVEEEQANPT